MGYRIDYSPLEDYKGKVFLDIEILGISILLMSYFSVIYIIHAINNLYIYILTYIKRLIVEEYVYILCLRLIKELKVKIINIYNNMLYKISSLLDSDWIDELLRLKLILRSILVIYITGNLLLLYPENSVLFNMFKINIVYLLLNMSIVTVVNMKKFDIWFLSELHMNKLIDIFVLSIEWVSYLSRLWSLTIRISLNILCGHLLLKVLVALCDILSIRLLDEIKDWDIYSILLIRLRESLVLIKPLIIIKKLEDLALVFKRLQSILEAIISLEMLIGILQGFIICTLLNIYLKETVK